MSRPAGVVALAWSAGAALFAFGLVVEACLVTPQTGDAALCCTCLNQKSPVNDGDALSPQENCLPDSAVDGSGGPGEVDQCNTEAAAFIADPTNPGAHPIHVVDELCGAQTCQQECNGAQLDGVKFVVTEQSISQ